MIRPAASRATALRQAARAFACTAALLCAACANDGHRLVEERLFAMGTWVDLAFEARDAEHAGTVLRAVQSFLRHFEIDYYPWAPGELQRLNEGLAAGERVVVSPDLAQLVRDAQRLAAASDDLFEPDIAALVELWGFHSGTEPRTEPPPASAIETWLASHAGIAALTIEGDMVSAVSTRVQLDLGGIAKGTAVDRILDLLREHEIGNGMVNIGGDLGIIGARGARPWRIGIRDPRAERMLGVIELDDGEAAFTSGDYERYYEHEGQRLHHILDPSTGRPAQHTRAVTVIARDGAVADAAATALFVAGPDRWRRIAGQLGIEHVLRIDASGAVEMTEAMAMRLAADDAQR